MSGGLGPPPEPAEFWRPAIELLPPPGVSLPAAPPRYALALSLFALSLFCATTLGAVYVLQTRTDVVGDLELVLTLRAIRTVWGNPWLLAQGFWFSTTALGILLIHELGHYVACRHYRLPVTLPYFLPSPIALGSFGAFIRIRAPLSDKRQLFDVGIAGPIAGFVALLPVLIWGAAHSRIVTLDSIAGPQAVLLYLPGHPLALELTLRAFHGITPAGSVIELHPAALGAWFGLLATALNLLPFGQLDGGHVLYATFGRLQRRLAWPLWITLAALSYYSPSWILWTLITLAIGLRHPPVLDEARALDGRRKVLAAVALMILVLSFNPVPMRILEIAAR